MQSSTLVNDLDAYWMPFTANRAFKSDPRILVKARGMHYTTADGRKILDGSSGLWCVNAGHGRPEIAAAVSRQLTDLDYAPSFQFGHPAAFQAASRLAAILPGTLNSVFFANSGSEAVDTALKIALAYHKSKGEPSRVRLIGRERGYHGVGFGGISVGGIPNNRKSFGNLLAATDHLPHTHLPDKNAFSRGQPAHGADCADALEDLLALHDPSTVAAVIIEPIAGSTGVLVPPVGYLERLRDICTRHGVLLIFDEVITGFGRVGAPFAADAFGVQPDLITMAKGLTNGAVPMGAVAVSDEIHKTCLAAAPAGTIELFHGYTYSGHPVAAAAMIATLDIYRDEGLFDRAAAIAPAFEAAAHAVRDSRHVVDIRTYGLVAGIELASRPGAPGARGAEVLKGCFERSAFVRVTGDIIALSPPLIIDDDQIAELFDCLGTVLNGIE